MARILFFCWYEYSRGVEALQKSAVLDKLSAVQKLERLDVEGAIHLYYNIILEPCKMCKDITNTELQHQYSFCFSFFAFSLAWKL